jgi:hypothetical protein
MGTSNPYAAGAKVYNGGSSTATSGTVDPMGYVERNLKMAVKAKPSQTRSGLAKAALGRVKKKTVVKKAVKKATTKKAFDRKESAKKEDAKKTRDNKAATAITAKPPVQAVTASATGKGVNPPKQNPVIALPYDLESQRISAKQSLDNLLAGLNAQVSELQTASQQRLRNLETQYSDRKVTDLNSSVARGLGNSSQYLNTLTKSASDYTTGKNTIASEKTSSLNNIRNQSANASTGYNNLRGAMYREAANRRAQASAAGTGGAALDSSYKAPSATTAPADEAYLKLPGYRTTPSAKQKKMSTKTRNKVLGAYKKAGLLPGQKKKKVRK